MRVLCATDLLPKSEMAIERAGMLANGPAASVTLVHVVVPSRSGLALEAKLQSAISLLRTRARAPRRRRGVSPKVVVRVGAPARRIVEEIANLDADLVVLGPHRKRGPRDALGGTIAESLLRARSTPVLIVKREPCHVYRKIVLAVDLSRVSAESLWAAERLILTPDVNAVIVHAYEPPYDRMVATADIRPRVVEGYRAGWTRHADQVLRDFLRRHSRDPGRYGLILERDRPATAVLRVARRIDPDLLVLGTHGRSQMGRALIGSVANAVLRAAKTDLLIVPRGAMRRRPARSSRRIAAPDRVAF